MSRRNVSAASAESPCGAGAELLAIAQLAYRRRVDTRSATPADTAHLGRGDVLQPTLTLRIDLDLQEIRLDDEAALDLPAIRKSASTKREQT